MKTTGRTPICVISMIGLTITHIIALANNIAVTVVVSIVTCCAPCCVHQLSPPPAVLQKNTVS